MAISYHTLGSHNKNLLANVAADVFDHPVRPDSLDAFVADERHVMVLAVDDGLVVGMASAVEYFHPDKEPELFINEVGVAPTHRRQGICRNLMDSLIRIAKDRGCVYAWVGTETDNVAARACYRSVPGGNPPQDFVFFEWEFRE